MKTKPTGKIGKSSTSKKKAKKEFSKRPGRATKQKGKKMIIPAETITNTPISGAQGPAIDKHRMNFLRDRARGIVAKAKSSIDEEPFENVIVLMKKALSDLKSAQAKMARNIRNSEFRKLPGFLAEYAKKKPESWGSGSSYSFHSIAQNVLDFVAFLLILESKGAVNLSKASTQAIVLDALAAWQEAPGGGRHFFMSAFLEKPTHFAPKPGKPVRSKKVDPDDYSVRILRAPEGGFFEATKGPKDGKSYRKWKRKVNAVQRAYESAPAGTQAIARAVIRKLKEVLSDCNTNTAMEIVWSLPNTRSDVRSEIHSYFYQFDVQKDNEARRKDDERRKNSLGRKKAA